MRMSRKRVRLASSTLTHHSHFSLKLRDRALAVVNVVVVASVLIWFHGSWCQFITYQYLMPVSQLLCLQYSDTLHTCTLKMELL